MFGFGTADVSFEGTSAATGISGLSSFFGSVLFAFAAQSECMSVEQFLPPRTQKQYGRILDLAILIAAIIYMLWGILCYIFFKDNTQVVHSTVYPLAELCCRMSFSTISSALKLTSSPAKPSVTIVLCG